MRKSLNEKIRGIFKHTKRGRIIGSLIKSIPFWGLIDRLLYLIIEYISVPFEYRPREEEMEIFGPYIKYPCPVLANGKPGKWDEGCAGSPRIFKEGGMYYNFYMGYNKDASVWGIGLATSTDLINWIKYEGNPVLRCGKEDAWDSKAIDGAFVTKFGNTYYMFHEGRSHLPYYFTQKIGLATSNDLFSWTNYEGNPILELGPPGSWDSEGLLAPYVDRVDNGYWMLYSGMDSKRRIRSGLAFSANLKNWSRFQWDPILDIGPPGSWDEKAAMMQKIIKIGDIYYSFYEGEATDGRIRIGLVYSTDRLNWMKYEKNPIIDLGYPGSFDDKKACSPFPVIVGDSIYLFYGAHPKNEIPGSIGLYWLSNCPFKSTLK